MPPTNIASELFGSDISCAVIGEGNLLGVCLRKLQNAGFYIECAFSNSTEVQSYCDDRSIPYFKRNAKLEEVLENKKIDFLFSISNPRILSDSVLKIPRVMTINYHDSPLPAYAGVHATSWAMINGETMHGVSWHIVETGIDTGHILQSRRVEICPDDTAHTLNLKCQEAAINSFDELLREIHSNSLKPRPQNSEKRSYYGLYALPPNMGILNFENNAASLYDTIRSLDFGQHDNALGVPRVKSSTDSFFLVKSAVVTCQYELSHPPGTILDVVGNDIIVSTLDNPIKISLANLNGSDITSDQYVNHGLRKGEQLSLLSVDHTNELAAIRKKESFWKQKLVKYDPTMFFMQHMCSLQSDTEQEDGVATETLNLPELPSSLVNGGPMAEYRYIRSAFIAFLARICCTSEVSVGLVANKDDIPHAISQLYANILPANVFLNLDHDVTETLKSISDELSKYETSGTYLNDMKYRYPELRDRRINHNIVLSGCHMNTEPNDSQHSTTISEKKQTHKCQEKQCSSSTIQNNVSFENSANANPSPLNQPKDILQECKVLVSFSGLQNHRLQMTYKKSSASECKTIIDVTRHFPVFLERLQQQTVKTLSGVAFMDEQHIKKLYRSSSTTGSLSNLRVSTLFADMCEKEGDKQALISTTSSISYQMLGTEVEGLADKLLSVLGSSCKSVVGIHLPNSLAYVVSLLAVLKCNLVFLPLPENIPIERFSFMVKDATVETIITYRNKLDSKEYKEIATYKIKSTTGRSETVVIAQNLKDENDNIHESFPIPSICQDDERDSGYAYIMYTSGSTGKPKGVLLKESAMINMALSQIRLWDINDEDIVAQFASIGFDASISEIFTSLFSGATLAVFQENEKLGQEFVNTVNQMQITTITLPPSVLTIYSPAILPSLTKVITAGEVCTLATAHKWTSEKGVRFFNAYGLTETTVCATSYEVSRVSKTKDLNREVPIGRSIDGVCIYILDNFMQLVPPHVVGEIYIGGVCLCQGYIGHASETNSRKIVRNPLSEDPDVLYKTGDHAYQDMEGNITFVGRLDDVIKLRGQRIDLGEVEQVIGKLVGVDIAVVVPHVCTRSNEVSVAAYISPKSLCRHKLKQSLVDVLPSYMIPTYIVKLDANEFPKTQSGKIDRRKLQRDETVHQVSKVLCQSQMTETQKIVSEIFASVLKIETSQVSNLDKHSSFQELGGSSLHLVMLQNEIDDKLKIHLSFLEILTADTIGELASLISTSKEGNV